MQMKLFNLINKLTIIFCLATGASALAESVTPFSRSQETASSALDKISNINVVNAREVFRDSGPMVGLSPAKTPSPLENLQRGPGIQLAMTIPTDFAQFAVNAKMVKAKTTKEINDKAQPAIEQPGSRGQLKPTNQNVPVPVSAHKPAPLSSFSLPPAMWLLGSGLLGLVGISRRKKITG
jgi:hypothetical protein